MVCGPLALVMTIDYYEIRSFLYLLFWQNCIKVYTEIIGLLY